MVLVLATSGRIPSPVPVPRPQQLLPSSESEYRVTIHNEAGESAAISLEIIYTLEQQYRRRDTEGTREGNTAMEQYS